MDAHELFRIYNDKCGGLPKARLLTPERERKCKMRLSHNNGSFVADWTRAVERAAVLPFCLGEGQQGWRADFDWFIRDDTNYLKVLEGKYDHGGQNGQRGESEAQAR